MHVLGRSGDLIMPNKLVKLYGAVLCLFLGFFFDSVFVFKNQNASTLFCCEASEMFYGQRNVVVVSR